MKTSILTQTRYDYVLSVRQWWAWLIVSGLKPLENRKWQTAYRGPLYIHAGKRWDPRYYGDVHYAMNAAILEEAFDYYELPFRTLRQLSAYTGKKTLFEIFETGVVIGKVDLVDCVENASSKWAVKGMWHWILENPTPLPSVPLSGQRGIFLSELREHYQKRRNLYGITHEMRPFHQAL